MSQEKLVETIESRVPGLFLIIFTFAMVELAILMICIGYSSNNHILKIYNPNNEIVYDDLYDERHIAEFKKLSGIENFKTEGYVLTRVAIENKFPTRTWIALSICIPLIVILFVVFVIKVFSDIFHTNEEETEKNKKDNLESDFEETRFEKLFSTLGRLNIYSLGATVIIVGLLLWMIPDLIIFLGKVSYQTISELKWVILGVVLFGGAYMILKAILSYKTKNEIIKQQADIQKNRDRLVIEAKLEQKLLENRPPD